MVYLYTPEMIDYDEAVQRILEGRCLECNRRLPEHEHTCSDYPVNILTRKLTNVKSYVSSQQQRLKDIVKDIEDIHERNEEIMRYIQEQLEKKKDV